MKKNKNRIIRAAVCIGVGVMVLSMAVFANFDNANGYNVIKTAVKNNLFADNYTMQCSISADVDGTGFSTVDASVKMDKNNNPAMSMSGSYTTPDNEFTLADSMTIQDGYCFNTSSGKGNSEMSVPSDESEAGIMIQQQDDMYVSKVKSKIDDKEQSDMTMQNDDLFNKEVGFIETLTDTLIGDMKNNIVLSNTTENDRTYTIDMTGDQLPKFMTSAFSLMSAGIKSSSQDMTDPDNTAVSAEEQAINEMFTGNSEPIIDRVSGSAVVDNNDRLTGFDGTLVITGYDASGNAKKVSFNVNMKFSDFGTTTIDTVNPDEYQEMTYSADNNSDKDKDGLFVVTE